MNYVGFLRGNEPKDKLTRENLIFSFLKSESSPIESNYMKYFNNRTSDDSYDDKIESKINDIRLILSRLGNIARDQKKIKKELYEIEKKQNLSDNEKEKIYNYLVKLAINLDKKEEHESNDHDDDVYFGIKELENLLSDIDDDVITIINQYLLKVPLKKIMNIRRAEEIRRKKKISKGISLCDYVVFSRFNK